MRHTEKICCHWHNISILQAASGFSCHVMCHGCVTAWIFCISFLHVNTSMHHFISHYCAIWLICYTFVQKNLMWFSAFLLKLFYDLISESDLLMKLKVQAFTILASVKHRIHMCIIAQEGSASSLLEVATHRLKYTWLGWSISCVIAIWTLTRYTIGQYRPNMQMLDII